MLSLLESFEILYPLPDSNTSRGKTYLLPFLLPEGEPNYQILWPIVCPSSRVEYGRQYNLLFLPTGLFSRLMISMYFYSKLFKKIRITTLYSIFIILEIRNHFN